MAVRLVPSGGAGRGGAVPTPTLAPTPGFSSTLASAPTPTPGLIRNIE